jgi:enoyl-CoA hydratase
MGPLVDTRRDDRVLFLTLDRPDQLNALNTEVLSRLRAHVEAAGDDATIGCIVITGAGERAFCAGADLGELRGLDTEGALQFIRNGQRTMSAIAASPVPIIAGVGGFALGGGLELMLACHLVLASRAASFGLPEAKLGCIPGFGGTQRLFHAAGKAPAMHLMLTAQRIDADRAWHVGLLSLPPVEVDELDQAVAEMAHRVADGSRTGNRNILDAARYSVDARALEHEATLAALAISSLDGQEGITAFAEHRKPSFDRGELLR